jgi:hypothetical protein
VVQAGATLAPGDATGALTVNNTVTLAAGSTTIMGVNGTTATNTEVLGASTLTYGGTLVLRNLGGKLAANDTFKLFTAGSYSGSFTNVVSETAGQTITWDVSQLTVDGSVKVTSAVGAPVALTVTANAGTLNLAWPASQIGWTLESQTNSLSVGLGTNWVAVAGSTTTNQLSLPVNPTNGAVFFRLVY